MPHFMSLENAEHFVHDNLAILEILQFFFKGLSNICTQCCVYQGSFVNATIRSKIKL